MIDDPNCECDLNIGCSGYLSEIPFDDDRKDKVTDKDDDDGKDKVADKGDDDGKDKVTDKGDDDGKGKVTDKGDLNKMFPFQFCEEFTSI